MYLRYINLCYIFIHNVKIGEEMTEKGANVLLTV